MRLHNAWAFGWASFTTDTASAMVTVLLPVFMLEVLGETPAKLGLVIGIGTFVSFALRWGAGWLSDVTRRPKLIAAVGYSLSAVAKPLFALCATWAGVAGLRVLERLGKAIRSAPRDALIAQTPESHAARAFGLHKALDLGGEATGMALVAGSFWLLVTPTDELVRGLLLATAIPGAVAVAIAWLVVREAPAPPPPTRTVPHLGRIGGRTLMLALFLLVIIDQPLLIGHMAQLGIGVPAISGIVFAGHLLSIAAALFLGKRLDGKSEARLTAGALALNLAALVTLAALWGTAITALAVFASLVAQSAMLVIARIRIARESREARGAAFGTFYLVVAVTGGTAAWAGGVVWTHFGFATLAAALAAINLAFALPLVIRPLLARAGVSGRRDN